VVSRRFSGTRLPWPRIESTQLERTLVGVKMSDLRAPSRQAWRAKRGRSRKSSCRLNTLGSWDVVVVHLDRGIKRPGGFSQLLTRSSPRRMIARFWSDAGASRPRGEGRVPVVGVALDADRMKFGQLRRAWLKSSLPEC
jgi:hypothetical protein